MLGGVWGTAECWRRDPLHSGLDGCPYVPDDLLALTSVSFIDSTKYKILAGTWLIIILKNVCLFLIEGTGPTQIALLKSEPLCPVVLNGIPARAIGMVFLLLSIILVSYSLIYKEGNGLAILIGQILKQGKQSLFI